MKKGICYIVGAGENYGLNFTPGVEDFVIAADAGLCYLKEAGIAADLIVGDFDSLQDTPQGGNVIKLPAKKDDTDLLIALKEGMKAGYRQFHIYCGTGGRIDHTIANLQLLAYVSERGMQGFLFHKDCVLTMVTNQGIVLEAADSGYVSVFSYSETSIGVYLKGLKYELHDAVLTNRFPLGVSNELIGKEGGISVKDGMLLVSFPRGVKVCRRD